jgi:hypothetical protein
LNIGAHPASGNGTSTAIRRAGWLCCACAVTGHAAAPPRSPMTSRRLMRSALQGGPILHVPFRVCNLNTSYNGNLSCSSRSATRSATERPMVLVLLKFSIRPCTLVCGSTGISPPIDFQHEIAFFIIVKIASRPAINKGPRQCRCRVKVFIPLLFY